ncbi:MAG: 50S ribosomal protein L10 [Abditibacteriales bacterium]|nr:50S ribosomal protein L10 [Abditibacteriales bacterium]MDW8365662.1 50S ribosomal protein L10 [Abditibacteriales bacterium]
MAHPEKEAIVADLHDKLKRATAVLLTEYRGLKAGQMTLLRRRLREGGLEYRVVKNTLMYLAAQGTRAEALCASLEGPTAVAFSYGEPTEAAKLLTQAAKDFESLKVRMGLIEGMVCDAAQVEEVAKLPGRREMRGRTVGTISGPLSGFLMITQGVLRNLVGILQAKIEKEASAS